MSTRRWVGVKILLAAFVLGAFMFFGGMSHRLIDISLGCFLMGVGAWGWWRVGPAATNKDMTGDSKADDHLRVKKDRTLAIGFFACGLLFLVAGLLE